MPRASKRPVNKNVLAELQDNFAFLISSLSSSKDIEHFFETFLTEEEKIMLTKRLMLHLMLGNGYEITEISTVLGLSKETVYKHKSISQSGDDTYKVIISKIASRRKTKEFWQQVEKLLRPIVLALDSKTNMKSRAKFLSGDY